MSDIEGAILAKVRELTSRPKRLRGAATEIYYDTRIYGEDLFDLIDWLIEGYGTDFSAMDVSHYAPGEGGNIVALALPLGYRPFRSLTVQDLAEAVSRGRWS